MAAVGLRRDEEELLVAAATAAPSLLNTQPWRFEVAGRTVELSADPTRQLTAVDPDGRQLHLSCGAALLNLRVAAEHLGYEPRVRLLPDPAARTLLARVDLSSRPRRVVGALYDAVPLRHTNRGPFDDRPVPPAALVAFVQAARLEGAELTVVTKAEERARLVQLVHLGDLEQDLDPARTRESVQWTGVEPERADGVPGYALGPLPYDAESAYRDLRRGAPVADRPRVVFEHAPTLAVLTTRTDDPAAWLRAGQALERVLLTATVEGVSASFLNQPLEARALRWLVRDPETGIGHPQMLLRLGYGTPVPATPRRPIEEVVDLG